VIDPKAIVSKSVVFGATICIENEDGKEFTYQIVGEDETKIEQGKISWKSPLARAFLGKKVGEEVQVVKPSGEENFTLVGLTFKPQE
jgi:transcription elongation factor GreB